MGIQKNCVSILEHVHFKVKYGSLCNRADRILHKRHIFIVTWLEPSDVCMFLKGQLFQADLLYKP